jgi:hypothetical protein
MCVVPAASALTVAEVQGLYGAFSFSEKLQQKIWLRGDFERAAAVMIDGRRLHIGHPGKWNLLAGPDFLGARLRVGDETGPEKTGDVEVHLHAGDWDAHGHARDPAYANVILHVVLYPPDQARPTAGMDGRPIPVLALLPLLHRSLEEFAADEAVEALANRPISRLAEELGGLTAGEIDALLRRCGARRWQQKVRFARLRLQRLGWEAACHHTALEILGYRFNRSPMLRLAGQFPVGAWARGSVTPDHAYVLEREGWSLQGVRPANHPRRRLRQYAAWAAARPDWAERVRSLASGLPAVDAAESDTRKVRRSGQFSRWRERIADEVFAEVVNGTRLDNLICDGALPLLAAAELPGLQGIWQHWFAGDLPPMLAGGLRHLGVFDGRGRPVCHGMAQGLLGWLLEREARPNG